MIARVLQPLVLVVALVATRLAAPTPTHLAAPAHDAPRDGVLEPAAAGHGAWLGHRAAPPRDLRRLRAGDGDPMSLVPTRGWIVQLLATGVGPPPRVRGLTVARTRDAVRARGPPAHG